MFWYGVALGNIYFPAYRSSPLKFGTTETVLSEMLLFRHSMSPESKEVNYGLCCTINVFYLFCNFQFHLERVEVFERFVNLLRIFNFQNVINFLFPLCKTYEMFWIFWQLLKVLSTPHSHGCVAGTECCTTAHCALWTLRLLLFILWSVSRKMFVLCFLCLKSGPQTKDCVSDTDYIKNRNNMFVNDAPQVGIG